MNERTANEIWGMIEAAGVPDSLTEEDKNSYEKYLKHRTFPDFEFPFFWDHFSAAGKEAWKAYLSVNFPLVEGLVGNTIHELTRVWGDQSDGESFFEESVWFGIQINLQILRIAECHWGLAALRLIIKAKPENHFRYQSRHELYLLMNPSSEIPELLANTKKRLKEAAAEFCASQKEREK
jgi:hypothetical protein